MDSFLDKACHPPTVNAQEPTSAKIQDADKMIAGTVQNEAEASAKLLATIPGVGYYSVLVIASEIGDVSRFPHSDNLVSYAGMTPSTYSSGGRTRHGGITKHGSAMLWSVLCECVLSHKRIRKDSNISEFHARIARKKGNPKATVAAGAKLLRICYRLLTEGREYSESVESNPRPALQSRVDTVKHFGRYPRVCICGILDGEGNDISEVVPHIGKCPNFGSFCAGEKRTCGGTLRTTMGFWRDLPD